MMTDKELLEKLRKKKQKLTNIEYRESYKIDHGYGYFSIGWRPINNDKSTKDKTK